MTRRVPSTLHKFIREELEARQWTNTQLADQLKVQPGVISRWLTEDDDKRVVPMPQMCAQIAESLGVDATEVLRYAGYLPLNSQSPGPHDEEIRVLTRRLRRMLKATPDEEWCLAYALSEAELDGLQLLLNRLALHNNNP